MRIDPQRIRKLLLVLLVVAATLAVSTSAGLGVHDHGQSAGTCNLCVIGHLGWIQPAAVTAILPPVMREWRDAADQPRRLLQQGAKETSSRAPPAC